MDFRLTHVSLIRRSLHVSPREILHDVSLEIPSTARVGIIGREGSGKSTLVQILAGLLPPAGGDVRLDGVDPWTPGRNGVLLRRRLGVTFQFPEEQFLRPTVEREFEDLLTVRNVPRNVQRERMREALEAMGLDLAGMEHRSPFTLSLGESRLLSIALALAVRPEALLFDEPTSGLDARGVERLHGVLSALRKDGRTVIVATHDLDFLREESDSILVLEGGRIAHGGPAGGILNNDARLERLGLQAGQADFRV